MNLIKIKCSLANWKTNNYAKKMNPLMSLSHLLTIITMLPAFSLAQGQTVEPKITIIKPKVEVADTIQRILLDQDKCEAAIKKDLSAGLKELCMSRCSSERSEDRVIRNLIEYNFEANGEIYTLDRPAHNLKIGLMSADVFNVSRGPVGLSIALNCVNGDIEVETSQPGFLDRANKIATDIYSKVVGSGKVNVHYNDTKNILTIAAVVPFAFIYDQKNEGTKLNFGPTAGDFVNQVEPYIKNTVVRVQLELNPELKEVNANTYSLYNGVSIKWYFYNKKEMGEFNKIAGANSSVDNNLGFIAASPASLVVDMPKVISALKELPALSKYNKPSAVTSVNRWITDSKSLSTLVKRQ